MTIMYMHIIFRAPRYIYVRLNLNHRMKYCARIKIIVKIDLFDCIKIKLYMHT